MTAKAKHDRAPWRGADRPVRVIDLPAEGRATSTTSSDYRDCRCCALRQSPHPQQRAAPRAEGRLLLTPSCRPIASAPGPVPSSRRSTARRCASPEGGSGDFRPPSVLNMHRNIGGPVPASPGSSTWTTASNVISSGLAKVIDLTSPRAPDADARVGTRATWPGAGARGHRGPPPMSGGSARCCWGATERRRSPMAGNEQTETEPHPYPKCENHRRLPAYQLARAIDSCLEPRAGRVRVSERPGHRYRWRRRSGVGVPRRTGSIPGCGGASIAG
jgi:hypothetical protein